MRNPLKYRLTTACEDLAVHAYLATNAFPRTEIYGLTSQIRRGAISIGSNFVEGCGRQSDKAFLPFLHQSFGSVNEMQFQLRVALRLGFGDAVQLQALSAEAASVGKQLGGLISAIRHDLK